MDTSFVDALLLAQEERLQEAQAQGKQGQASCRPALERRLPPSLFQSPRPLREFRGAVTLSPPQGAPRAL